MAFFKNAPAAPARKIATHMTFRAGGQLYGVPLDMLAEVTAAGALSQLNDCDPAVAGQMDLRGSALVVLDMGLRLQGVPAATPHNCILIVKRSSARSGCLVDAPGRMVSVPESGIELSGCLVGGAEGAALIPVSDIKTPENMSASGEPHGFPMYRLDGETILLPPAGTLLSPVISHILSQ